MTAFIGRREVITLLSGAAAWPVAVRAQQQNVIRRIGVLLAGGAEDPQYISWLAAFTDELQKFGWREGSNIRIDVRWASGDATRLPLSAAELVDLKPELIFSSGTPPTTAIRQIAPALPTVFVSVTDPVATGLVESLARPGGKITGFTNFEFTLGGKWLGTLKEVAPQVTRVAVFLNPKNSALRGILQVVESAASALGVRVIATPVSNTSEIERNIDLVAAQPGAGLLVLEDFITFSARELIVTTALRHKLPAVSSDRSFVAAGLLASYGVERTELFRRSASYVDRILKGEKPADLPVQAPTKYELVINLKTAKALNLEIPPSLLARADEVIE